jgi:hypothetical protein
MLTWYLPGIVSRRPMLTARSHPAVVVGGVSSPGVGVAVGVEVGVGVGVGLCVSVGVGVGAGVGLGVGVDVGVTVGDDEDDDETGESSPELTAGGVAALAGCTVATCGGETVLLPDSDGVPVVAG